ncbi:MAG: hypothetical protein OCD00_07000 [Colwellia sp.]
MNNNQLDKVDKQLSQQIDLLSNEIEPQRDLWSGIERAIQNKPQEQVYIKKENSFAPVAWAASVIVAVLITWLSISPEPKSLLVNNADKTIVAGQLIALMQQNFTQQKQAMLVSFGEPDLSDLSENMKTQLQQLASARQTIEKALLADEGNIDLLNLLRFTQQQELNLLQQLYSPQWQTI